MTTQLVTDIKSCQQNILAPVYFQFNNTIYYIVSLMYDWKDITMIELIW